MITTEQANKLYKLIKKYRDAAVNDSWKGASPPSERKEIKAALNRAVKNLNAFIDELRTAPATPSDSGSVDTAEFRKLEAAYAKAIFDFTDDSSKTNGESMATARNVFVDHIESLIDGVRKDAERLDWLSAAVEYGCVTSCFEIDGGIHLTLDPVGEEQKAYRNKDNLRAAIDAAMASHSPATSSKEA